MCFDNTKNFCFVKHMLKMSGFPNKSIFMFRIKGGMKKGRGLPSQNCFKLGGLKWWFSPMVYKSNVSCLPQTNILSLMTPTIFVRILRDICYLLKYAQRVGVTTSLCVPSLIPKDKKAFHWEPWHFLHMCDKSKVSYIFKIQNTHFIFYDPYPFCSYFRR